LSFLFTVFPFEGEHVELILEFFIMRYLLRAGAVRAPLVSLSVSARALSTTPRLERQAKKGKPKPFIKKGNGNLDVSRGGAVCYSPIFKN